MKALDGWRAAARVASAALCVAALAVADPPPPLPPVIFPGGPGGGWTAPPPDATPDEPPGPAPEPASRPALPPAPYRLASVLGDPSFRHDDDVTQAVALADGNRLLTSGNDGTARLWDLTTGRLLQTYRHRKGYVWDVLPLPGDTRLLTTGGEGAVILWDLATGERLKEFPHGAMTFRVAVDAGGRRAVAGDSNGQCIVWDLAAGKQLACFEAAGSGDDSSGRPSLYTVQFGPDGNSVIAGCSDSTIRSWRLADGRERSLKQKDRKIKLSELIGGLGDTADIFTLAAPANRKRLLVCCEKRAPWLMDAASGREIWRAKNMDYVRCGAWSPDGKSLAVLGNRKLSVLDAAGGAKRWSQELTDGTNYGVAWNTRGTEVLVGSDHLVVRLDANTGQRTFPPPGARLQHQEASAAPLSADLLLECGGEGGIRVRDRRTRQVKETWLAEEAFEHVRVSSDGLTVAAATRKFVVALDGRTGKEVRRWPTESYSAEFLLSPDGKWLLLQDEDGLGVWRLPDGQKLLTLSREQVGWSSGRPAFGPDLELAIPSGNGPILVYKLPEGELVQELAKPRRQDPENRYSRDSWSGLAFLPTDPPGLVCWDNKELCLWTTGASDANGPSEADVQRLVGQLSSTSFRDREAATEALAAGGRAVLPLLRRLDPQDAETKARLLLVQKKVLASGVPRLTSTLELKEGGEVSFAVHPDGRRWALAHGSPPDREVLLGEVRGRELVPLGALQTPHAARSIVFDSRGILVTGNYNGTVCEYAPAAATQPASAPAR